MIGPQRPDRGPARLARGNDCGINIVTVRLIRGRVGVHLFDT
jgi:hypothetical protein